MIEEIFKELENLNKNIVNKYNSGENWIGYATSQIKDCIIDVAHKKNENFSVCCRHSEKADEGEWLYDIVVVELFPDGDFTKVIDVPLVVESEFSKTHFGGFKEDFDKLLIASKSEKLFIMRINNYKEFENIRQYAQDSINLNKGIEVGKGFSLIYWDEIGEEKKFNKIDIVKAS